jgi:hypothetical protein
VQLQRNVNEKILGKAPLCPANMKLRDRKEILTLRGIVGTKCARTRRFPFLGHRMPIHTWLVFLVHHLLSATVLRVTAMMQSRRPFHQRMMTTMLGESHGQEKRRKSSEKMKQNQLLEPATLVDLAGQQRSRVKGVVANLKWPLTEQAFRWPLL